MRTERTYGWASCGSSSSAQVHGAPMMPIAPPTRDSFDLAVFNEVGKKLE